MPRISYSHVRLGSARSDLERAWRATASTWKDEARQEFEEEYIVELLNVTRTTMTAMNELTGLLNRVVRQCS